jgi:hypothetical protein
MIAREEVAEGKCSRGLAEALREVIQYLESL